MLTYFADAFALLVLAFVVSANAILLGVAIWVAARSIAELQRTRAHWVSVNSQEETTKAAHEALDDLEEHRVTHGYRPPAPEDDLRRAVQLEFGEEPPDEPPPSYREAPPPVKHPPPAAWDEDEVTTTTLNDLRSPVSDAEAAEGIPPDRVYVFDQ